MTAAPTTLDQLKELVPSWAKDIKINLGVIAASTALTPRLAWGSALAAATVSRSPATLAAVLGSAADHLDATALDAARTAGALMAMNNVYYRSCHMLGTDAGYDKMPARLRMQAIGNPGVDHLDFELWCLAASAIGGCEVCLGAHERVVLERGATKEMVHDAIRIASVVHAVSTLVL